MSRIYSSEEMSKDVASGMSREDFKKKYMNTDGNHVGDDYKNLMVVAEELGVADPQNEPLTEEQKKNWNKMKFAIKEDSKVKVVK